MKWRSLLVLLMVLFVIGGTALFPQLTPEQTEPAPLESPAAKPQKPQFFAGLVMESDSTHVKVSRTLLGRATETRVFVVDAKTKTPKGGIKTKSRVTVRYQHLPQHDVALEIQVRPLNRAPKNS